MTHGLFYFAGTYADENWPRWGPSCCMVMQIDTQLQLKCLGCFKKLVIVRWRDASRTAHVFLPRTMLQTTVGHYVCSCMRPIKSALCTLHCAQLNTPKCASLNFMCNGQSFSRGALAENQIKLISIEVAVRLCLQRYQIRLCGLSHLRLIISITQIDPFLITQIDSSPIQQIN